MPAARVELGKSTAPGEHGIPNAPPDDGEHATIRITLGEYSAVRSWREERIARKCGQNVGTSSRDPIGGDMLGP
ncbi:hypothetical protein GCM10011490_24550 [Pseudoclavibacter endophyticus]|nr:hypothetical protein GCM10011490_24550 [Pseudoclavibacter endophyticus]